MQKGTSFINPKKIKKGTGALKRQNKRDNDFSDNSSCSSKEDFENINEDKEYRVILKELTKCGKNYKIKELSMSADPVTRRERFGIWVSVLISQFMLYLYVSWMQY
jgi:hypothetical protein